jgi:hypothetical protein
MKISLKAAKPRNPTKMIKGVQRHKDVRFVCKHEKREITRALTAV